MCSVRHAVRTSRQAPARELSAHTLGLSLQVLGGARAPRERSPHRPPRIACAHARLGTSLRECLLSCQRNPPQVVDFQKVRRPALEQRSTSRLGVESGSITCCARTGLLVVVPREGRCETLGAARIPGAPGLAAAPLDGERPWALAPSERRSPARVRWAPARAGQAATTRQGGCVAGLAHPVPR